MPDAMDQAQQLNIDHVEDSIKRHESKPRLVGRAMCADTDCGEPISDYRRQGGAQLCVACQHAKEQQQRHFRKWQGR